MAMIVWCLVCTRHTSITGRDFKTVRVSRRAAEAGRISRATAGKSRKQTEKQQEKNWQKIGRFSGTMAKPIRQPKWCASVFGRFTVHKCGTRWRSGLGVGLYSSSFAFSTVLPFRLLHWLPFVRRLSAVLFTAPRPSRPLPVQRGQYSAGESGKRVRNVWE